MAGVLAITVLCFGKPLSEVALLAVRSPVYSYILLLPFVTVYLLSVEPSKVVWNRVPRRFPALVPLAAGLAILLGYFLATGRGWAPSPEDRLAALTLSLVCFVYAIVAAWMSGSSSRGVVLPLSLLVFVAPFPSVVLSGIEGFLQHRSADVAQLFFMVAGTPFVRDETFFRLPGISLVVAPECSGVRSTLALFITSLVAAHLILRSSWSKAVLVAFVLPLAIARNAFRIFTIGQLCIHFGPQMIDSPLHHRGGPIFFALSLIPFLLLLLYLRGREKKRNTGMAAAASTRTETTHS
jgi:exosortase C (VPDSG-CTERM-specific)